MSSAIDDLPPPPPAQGSGMSGIDDLPPPPAPALPLPTELAPAGDTALPPPPPAPPLLAAAAAIALGEGKQKASQSKMRVSAICALTFITPMHVPAAAIRPCK